MALTNPQIPKPVNFSKNFIPIRFVSDNFWDKENYNIVVKIRIDVFENDGVDYDTIDYTTLRLPITPNSGGSASTDLAELLHAYLEEKEPDFPDLGSTNAKLCHNSAIRFSYQYGEMWGDMAEPASYNLSESRYIALYGGLSYQAAFNTNMLDLIRPDIADASKDRFLRQGNAIQYTRTNQPQFLSFFNSRTKKEDAVLKAKLYYKDETNITKTVTTFDLLEDKKYSFNLTYDTVFTELERGKQAIKYEFWLESSTGDKLSETRTFFLDYQYREFVRYFLFWSSWGAFDTRLTYGKGTSEIELVQQEAKRIRKHGYRITDGDTRNFDIKINSGFKVATGWMGKKDIAHNRDFYISNFKFRYTGGLLLPISITSRTIPEITDSNGLISQTFEYRYNFDDDCYTEGDVEENGESFDGFFFYSNPVINPTGGFTETDPTVPVWVKSISMADIIRWDMGGAAVDLSNYYTKNQVNNNFYPLNSNPANYLTASANDFIKNQTDLQVGAKLHVSGGNFVDYLTIPTAPSSDPATLGKIQIYFDEAGTGGSAIAPPTVAYLRDLLDVNILSALDGQALVKEGAFWVAKNVAADLSNIYNKSEINNFFSGAVAITGYNKNNWDVAYGNSHTHANKAFLDGVTAGATVGINISGNANSATNWGGLASNYNSGVQGGGIATLLGVHGNGYAYSFNKNGVQSWLGLGTRSNWADIGSRNLVVGQLSWSNYNNDHVILDISSGYTPDGVAHGRNDAENVWTPSFPTLVGWNGSSTFGVRVDSARTADWAVNTNETLQSVWNRGQWIEENVTREDWNGRFGHKNSAIDRSVFLATYSNKAVVASHNYNLNAWADLYVNTVNGTDGGNVFIGSNLNIGFATNLGHRLSVGGNIFQSGGNGQGILFEGGNQITRENSLDLAITTRNLGIGTASPDRKFHTVGLAKIQADWDGSYWDGPQLQIMGVNPAIAFHWPGVYASSLRLLSSGRLHWGANGFETANSISIIGHAKYISSEDGFVNDNWYRSIGDTGWYNNTYGVGIYSISSGWVRTYNNASFETEAELKGSTVRATNALHIPIKSGGVATGNTIELYFEEL